LTFDDTGNPTGVHADRYEFWVYRQLRKRLQSGELHLDDSLQHRHLSAELVSAERQAQALEQLDIAWLRQPIDAHLAALSVNLSEQWRAFDAELREGKLTHLDFDPASRTLTFRAPKAVDDEPKEAFYEQLPFCDIADVFRFVNEQTRFLSALIPLQPRYARHVADADSLMAVIVA